MKLDLMVIRKAIKTDVFPFGMSQSDVARAVGVSLMTYQLWERGNMNPNPENKAKLYEVLDIKE